MATTDTLIVAGSAPFLFLGGKTGCVLLHGFTTMPEEMRALGEYLSRRGLTVLGVRLAGHATRPQDLARTRWTDWLVSVEEGLALLRGIAERVVVIGLSMGGAIALIAAARYPVAGVVAMSTPYFRVESSRRGESPPQGMIRKPWVKRGGPLAGRREPGYPAYPAYPRAVLLEIAKLQRALAATLPRVKAPALLLHSTADTIVPVEALEAIHRRLGSTTKEKRVFDKLGHALVFGPGRQVVFEQIARFVRQLGE